MIDKCVRLVIPDKSPLIVEEFVKPGFFSFAQTMIRPDARAWVAEQFGYNIAKTPARRVRPKPHYIIHFRSERDATLFKTFWC